MTITKTQYQTVFEKAAGSYDLDISLPGCVSIEDVVSVTNQDVTVNKTLMAGSATIDFTMPVIAANHQDTADNAELVALTFTDKANADIGYVDGEWIEGAALASAPASGTALYFKVGETVSTASGYSNGRISSPSYTIDGESLQDYDELTATRYFMLRAEYKYLAETKDLVTVGVSAFTDNAGLTVNGSTTVQDYFIVTVVVTGPAQPTVTLE